jgi:hypothetical protein
MLVECDSLTRLQSHKLASCDRFFKGNDTINMHIFSRCINKPRKLGLFRISKNTIQNYHRKLVFQIFAWKNDYALQKRTRCGHFIKRACQVYHHSHSKCYAKGSLSVLKSPNRTDLDYYEISLFGKQDLER